MDIKILDILAVFSLFLLTTSFLLLVIALLPVFLQLTRTLNLINSISSSFKREILPNLIGLANIFGRVNKTVKKGQTIQSKFQDKISLLKETVRNYFIGLKKEKS